MSKYLSKYPEHDKLHEVKKDKSQAIGEFLEWLQSSRGVILGEWLEGYEDRLQPISEDIQALLAEYFEIDLDKIEEEKCQMLEEMRKNQGL